MEHKRIVVGVDGSPSSLLALRWAARLVPTVATSITAVAAWQVPFTYYEFPVSGWDPKSVAQTILSKALDEAFGGEPPPFITAETHQGPAAGVLIDESRNAEMLIVGSRGHGGFVGLLLGSVSSAVAEHASCPVLVAHGHEKEKTRSAGSNTG